MRLCRFSGRKFSLLTSALHCIVCISLLACLAKAQYRFDSWTTDNGLPQNSVFSILQTGDGYIWFTTLDGLARFDGVRFTVFNKLNSKNLSSNRLTSLFADGDTLWIGTEENALARYRNGEFKNFSSADGLPSDVVYEVAKDVDGTILIYTSKGAVGFDGGSFSPLPNLKIDKSRIYVTPSGVRWEMNTEVLSVSRNGIKTDYDLPNEIKKEFTDEYNLFAFIKMLETGDEEFWFVVGRSLFKLQRGVIEEVKTGVTLKSAITAIARDRHGNIWFGTDDQGVCRLGQSASVCFNSKNAPVGNVVRGIITDREGTLWVATSDKGIYRVAEQVVAPLSAAQGLGGKNVYSVMEDSRGAVWIGSFDSLSKIEDGVTTNYTVREGLIYPYIQSLFEDRDGRLWIGSLDGVQYFENGKFYDFTKRFDVQGGNFHVFDIHRDRQGILWFATSQGLFKFDGATAERLTTDDGLPNNNIKAILETRDGSVWVGTYNGIAYLKDGKFVAFTEKNGLAGGHVRALYEDETGTIWIGTYDSGLTRLRDGKFTNYNTENGLFSNGVFQILEDASGNFWMSSNQGIYRVSRQQLNEFADGKRQSIFSTFFGKSDGMLNAECNGGGQPAGAKTRDGRLWFPTQDGAAIVDPEVVPFNPLPPPVVVETVKIDNQELNDFQSAIRNPKSVIEMQPGQENLEIDYTGLSFIKPEQIRFRYRLEGLDENWTEAGTRRTAFYPYLPPGNYTFRVTAANSDNVWNETGATLSIVVKPPFYQKWYFILACAALFSFVIYTIYRARVLQLERARRAQEEFSRRLINAHETERRRVAAELHDSIGQSLAMIKNRAVFGAQTATDAAVKEQLELITEQTAQTIGEVREISYNLRPYLLERLGLTKAVKSLVRKIAETHCLRIEFEIDDVDNLFASEAEMSVYRIVQESLSNVVKHAAAGRATVSIRKTENALKITIEDDGRGFDANAPRQDGDASRGGFGLLGLTERVRMLGGSHQIESVAGKGTKVIVNIGLNKKQKESNDGK